MSPEQAAGGRVLDPRADVYSLGATLDELLTGQPAFGGDDRAELLRRITRTEPVQPRRLDRSIPRDLETILGTAMDKEPERRYATARELADDLGRSSTAGRSMRGGRARWNAWRAGRGGMHEPPTPPPHCWSSRSWRPHPEWPGSGGSSSARGRRCSRPRGARRYERQGLFLTFAASDQVAERALVRVASAAVPQDPVAAEHDRAFCRTALAHYQEIARRDRRDPEMASIVAAAEHWTRLNGRGTSGSGTPPAGRG